MKIHTYSDGGHGWAKVSKKLLMKLGIADTISHYSYSRKEYAYLEEDCDLSKFIAAIGRDNIQFIEHYSHKQSKIRGYDRYIPPATEEKSYV